MSIFVVGTESVFFVYLVLIPNQPSAVSVRKVDQQRDRLPLIDWSLPASPHPLRRISMLAHRTHILFINGFRHVVELIYTYRVGMRGNNNNNNRLPSLSGKLSSKLKTCMTQNISKVRYLGPAKLFLRFGHSIPRCFHYH